MRIGMVSATYDQTVVNGAVHMVTLYKKCLEALGHEVTIFTLGEQADTDQANRIIRSPGIRLGGYGYYLSNSYTREAQATNRPRVVFVVIAAVEVRVSQNGLTRDIIKGNVLC